MALVNSNRSEGGNTLLIPDYYNILTFAHLLVNKYKYIFLITMQNKGEIWLDIVYYYRGLLNQWFSIIIKSFSLNKSYIGLIKIDIYTYYFIVREYKFTILTDF